MNYKDAWHIASNLIFELGNCCTKVAVAGSLRRGKDEVKDIEIVAVPNMSEDLFGKNIPDNAAIYRKLSGMNVEFEKNGIRYKKMMLPQGISLDLFLVWDPAQWGVIYTIRTGPADFSHWIVTPKAKGGALPTFAKVKDGAVYAGSKLMPMPEEEDFLDFLGLGWIEPSERKARWPR